MYEVRDRIVARVDTKDPEEVELAACFNAVFMKILKALPKSDRKVLFEMLTIISSLYTKVLVKTFKFGVSCGYKGGIKYYANQTNKEI